MLSSGFANPETAASASPGSAAKDGCADCHRKQTSEVVAVFARSTHAKSKISCVKCHGGDDSVDDKEKAHDSTLVAKPSANDTLRMCGFCHFQPLSSFKTSRHFPDRRGAPRLDCTQCHGAHSVGAQARSFSLGLFCAGCHGLEYLPELPERFQQMLTLSDDIRSSMRDLADSGRAPSEEITKRRLEIRRRIAEIVHPADLRGGQEKIPEILKLGGEFKQIIDKAR